MVIISLYSCRIHIWRLTTYIWLILSNELDVKDCKSDKSLKSILTSISERRLMEIFFNFKWAFFPVLLGAQTINITFKFVINYKCECRISFLWHAHTSRYNHCLLVAENTIHGNKKVWYSPSSRDKRRLS